ncbi:MAG TPA: nucleotidyl transferase AbiEii/AbiGii toxin family protein [Patescibacteria group bacterium]|nr:nucleotidyl transferase AbiEii/AbiGii toxin family protein [Patescibacteria group bacterium]
MLHYDILDPERKEILPKLAVFKRQFYLAGGTALALQIGHRDSLDFDFFSKEDIDTVKLFEKVQEVFAGQVIVKTQEEKNTLSVNIDKVKLSFMTYSYELVDKLIETEFLNLASVKDIACMKLSAITSRATLKDYVDLYFILKNLTLEELLNSAKDKFPQLDTGLVLKSLVYFDDIVEEPIIFKEGNKVSLDEIKQKLDGEVKKYLEERII